MWALRVKRLGKLEVCICLCLNLARQCGRAHWVRALELVLFRLEAGSKFGLDGGGEDLRSHLLKRRFTGAGGCLSHGVSANQVHCWLSDLCVRGLLDEVRHLRR